MCGAFHIQHQPLYCAYTLTVLRKYHKVGWLGGYHGDKTLAKTQTQTRFKISMLKQWGSQNTKTSKTFLDPYASHVQHLVIHMTEAHLHIHAIMNPARTHLHCQSVIMDSVVFWSSWSKSNPTARGCTNTC